MTVVLRIGPPHIHVRRDAKIAKFWLDPVDLAVQGRFPLHEITKIRHMVEDNRRLLLEAWNAYFDSSAN